MKPAAGNSSLCSMTLTTNGESKIMSYSTERQVHEASQTNKLILAFFILVVVVLGAVLIHDLEIRKLDLQMECIK